jgi:signal transduction histidine kinase
MHTKDSLVEELKKYPNADTARADALFKVVDCAAFLSEKKAVLPYWEEGIQLSHKRNYKKGEAEYLAWRGSYYKSAQKTDSALTYLDSAIQVVGNSPDKALRLRKGFALFFKGMIYENQENLYKALNYYFESLTTYDSADLVRQKGLRGKIAHIYQQLNNDDKALEYYKQVIDLIEHGDDGTPKYKLDGNYISIAEIYFKRDDLSKAKYYLNVLKPMMPDSEETIITGGYYRLTGQIALKEKMPDSAFRLLKEALKYYNYTRVMHSGTMATICSDIARLKMQSKEMDEAKKYAEESVAAAKESGHKEDMAGALICMAEYDHETGNQAGAYTDLRQAMTLNDSVLAAANIKQANTLAAIYENDQKEKLIAGLETDEKIEAASVKQKALWNTIFIITIVALLFISGMLYRNFKSRQKIEQQKISELEKEKQLLAVAAMLKGQEEERSRLAKDLHDGLGGMLSGVKISISNMKENLVMDEQHASLLAKSIAQLDNTIMELRKVSHNLMPEALVKFGLKSALQDFCESMQLNSGTTIICEQLGEERELGNIADVNIYRIIQELINNAIKHAQPTQVLVQLTKAPAKVLITVEDNGKGFDLKELDTSTGIGFANTRHRVNYFNGRMDIESKPGEGTTINIELIA